MNIESITRKMLDSLSGINGFKEYEKELQSRYKNTLSWQLEVKALFEFNRMGILREIPKNNHALSNPDGLLVYGSSLGILECKQIDCSFMSNEDDSKEINSMVQQLDKIGEVRLFTSSNNKRDFYLEKKLGGVITMGNNLDVNKQIESSYIKKRKQHKRYYPVDSYFKVYYFEINPPSSFDKIDTSIIINYIHNRECIILYNSYVVAGEFYENKIYVQNNIDYNFSLKNEYFNPNRLLVFKDCSILSDTKF